MLFIVLLAAATAASAAPDAKTMAVDDWHHSNIVSVGSPSPTSPATYLVIQAGDLDGDGVLDDAYLKLDCAEGKLSKAWYQVKGPRDAASGMPTGKRQHGSVTFVKEWGPATPQLRAIQPSYDVKTVEGTGRTAIGNWAPISLTNTDGLCTAAGEAALKVTKSRSNIQNN